MDMRQVGQAINNYWGNVSGREVRQMKQTYEDGIAKIRHKQLENLEAEKKMVNDDLERFDDNVHAYYRFLTKKMQKEDPYMHPIDAHNKVRIENPIDEFSTPERERQLKRLDEIRQEALNAEFSNPLPIHIQKSYEKQLKQKERERNEIRLNTTLGLGVAGVIGANVAAASAEEKKNAMNKEASLTLRSIYKKEN